MNYGRAGVEREREALQATASRAGNRIGLIAMRVILFMLVAACVAALCLGIGAYQGIIDDSPQITDANIMPLGYASFVYDQNGTQIQKLNSVEGNRVSISFRDIPVDMQHAIVAIEDSRFYEHNGVDPHGMIRALLVAVQSGLSRTEGASTITQQLLKNNVFTDWMRETRLSGIKRKLQEQYLAVQLEESLAQAGEDPKQVILENYLNTVNFGSGAYGVQTAAQTYFGKDAKDLSLSECAVLAAIPQNPSQYNPRIYPEDNADRMHTVLDYMLDQGYITREAHDEAMADPVYDRVLDEDETTASQSEIYSYFIDELIEQVKEGLMREKGYSEVQATNAIYNGGLKIYSTEDPAIQSILEEEFRNQANFPADSKVGLDWALTVDHADGSRQNYSREMMQSWYWENGDENFTLNFASEAAAQSAVDTYKAAIVGRTDEIVAERISFIPQPQACMTVIDQATGQVKGIVGGRGEKVGSLTLNRATGSYRQPGNIFMIPSTYAPALDLNRINLATRVTDEEFFYQSSAPVHNETEEHAGNMRVRQAIATSNNVIAVKTLTNLSPQLGLQYLKKLGITTLVDDPEGDVQQMLAIGNVSRGVNNLELTAAFAAIANGGAYREPIFYTRVTDRVGNVVLENNQLPSRVFKDSTCYLLTSALQDAVREGTAAPYQLSNPAIAVAGKTGTNGNHVDQTFVGYTPYYTAGIWTGFDTNTELPESNRAYISKLWTNVMNRVHRDLAAATFRPPTGIVEATICADSGLLAGRGCQTTTEIFAAGSVPASTCTEHTPRPTPIPTPKPTATPTPTPEGDGQNGQQQDGQTPAENPQPDGGENPAAEQNPEQPAEQPADGGAGDGSGEGSGEGTGEG